MKAARAALAAALLLLASLATLGYADAQVIANRPPPPQTYKCGEEYGKLLCQCQGASDCVDMKNGGQCSGGIKVASNIGTCTWKGPPSQPSAMTRLPTRGGPGALATPTGKPTPYACTFKGGVMTGCACVDVGDCLKLNDTKMCGSWPIVDDNVAKGSGKCGSP